MKAICPISGVPFRTYDSLPIHLAYKHPIFSLDLSVLVNLLEDIRKQEHEILITITKDSDKDTRDAELLSNIRMLTNETVEAISERNWRNPAFKLYQTKHLVLLALMHSADLLHNEPGYAARPRPQIIEAYFWRATELFVWCNTVSNQQVLDQLPHYKVSSTNEGMENFAHYLEILEGVKTHVGNRYRSISEEKKLESWEKAISILTRRREILHKDITAGTNHLAAKWALTMTRAPKDMYEFWFGILSSSSLKITFEGVKINNRWEPVTEGDLNELRDYLEDNLISPQGEHKEYHRDDSEYYFIARQTVLSIVRRHLMILTQGATSFEVVNVALGDKILSASDAQLEEQAIEAGLERMPRISEHIGKSRFQFVVAMATWRHNTKRALLEKLEPDDQHKAKQTARHNYEIL